MNGRDRVPGEVGWDHAATIPRHPKLTTEKCLRGGGAEANEHLRVDDLELLVEPRSAGCDLSRTRLLVIRRVSLGTHLKCFTAFVT